MLSKDDGTVLAKPDLSSIVAKYKGTKEGLGVLFIAERYDRVRDLALHHIVIFDIASKKVLLTQKYSIEPFGVGIRNYWASTLYFSLKAASSNYGKWRRKANK